MRSQHSWDRRPQWHFPIKIAVALTLQWKKLEETAGFQVILSARDDLTSTLSVICLQA